MSNRYIELKEEYIRLINRSIRQKVFNPEKVFNNTIDSINSVFQKYNTDTVDVNLSRNKSHYNLNICIHVPWETNKFLTSGRLDIESPSSSLFVFLELRNQLDLLFRLNLQQCYYDKKEEPLSDYMKNSSDKVTFFKNEIDKYLEKEKELKKEIALLFLLLKKENESFMKWTKARNKRLERIYLLQKELNEAWIAETPLKEYDPIFISTKSEAGLVIKELGDNYATTLSPPLPWTIGDITPYSKKTFEGFQEHVVRNIFLTEEFTKNILPYLQTDKLD